MLLTKVLLRLGIISLLTLLCVMILFRMKQQLSFNKMLKVFETSPDPNMARLEKYVEENGNLFQDESKLEFEKELLESAIPNLTVEIKDKN